ncbi:MAG: zinc-dependent metalloprotease, partial [Muribaculaceae bacterium]|nr:zinc-dependent metalloprotease [Muribaculaceae bacterium]
RGVRLTPPPIGVYDIHAINWGYRLIPDAKDMFDEKPTLDKWIREHDGDPMYEFGAQQMLGLMDPTDQTEDLGNDHIKAGDLAISNLKIIMDNFEDWAGEPGESYEQLYKTYKSVVNQYGRHISHVIPYIGGVRFKEVRQGADDGNARYYFSRADQKKAMDWLLKQVRDCDWLTPSDLLAKFEEPDNWREKVERSVIGCFTSPVVLGRVKKSWQSDSKNGYNVEDFMDDVTAGVFEASYKNRPLNDTERSLQTAAIAAMAKQSGLDKLSNVAVSEKGLDAEEDFMNFMALYSSPAALCSHDMCLQNLDKDEARSFFRIALGDSPLPPAEIKPLMTRQLRKVRNLYAKCAGSAPDAKSREYYSYQLKVIDKLLNP